MEEKVKVEIILCKDCEFHEYGKDWCNLHDIGMLDIDFCSYGEPKKYN